MDATNDIRDFLTSRRARLTPQKAGLPDYGGRRRVPGLRREEVALLAGMSAEYYVRLERGNAVGFSEAVLEGVSRALQLDDTERSHLYDLVRAANIGSRSMQRRPAQYKAQVRASLQQTIDAMSTVPVFVQNGRLDAVATNQLGHALFSEMFVDPRRPMNAARFVFLDPRAPSFYLDWDGNTRQIVAILRREAGRNPYDRNLTDLVGELSTQSELFRKLWSSHDVREHRTGIKSVHHPVVGNLDLTFETMDLVSERGLQMLVFSAEPGSASHDGLQLLAGWAATHDLPLPAPEATKLHDTAQ
jgi:transcriptional regulator with XRE-family HTH domain